MALIGFARVSTEKQDLTEQIKALEKAGCKKIFQGKNSGKKESNTSRLAELTAYIREGDIVVVTRLDRLGRSMKQIITFLDYLKQHNIDFKTLDEAIDTTKRNDPIAIAYTYLLGIFAELERDIIISRIKEGKAAKGKKGIGGRPQALQGELLVKFKRDCLKGLSLSQLAKDYDLSISTAYRTRKRILAEKA